MELDFSFFGFSPKPRTKNIDQACSRNDTSNSKLSLKKKQNTKVGLSSASIKPKDLVKEFVPTYDDAPKEKYASQFNSMVESSADKENSNPNVSSVRWHADSYSVQNIQCISPSRCESIGDVDNCIIEDSFTKPKSIEVSAVSISSDDSVTDNNAKNVNTIVISDSSYCSTRTEKSVGLHKSSERILNSLVCSDSSFCYKENKLERTPATSNYVNFSSLLSHKNNSALPHHQNALPCDYVSESSSDSSRCGLITVSSRKNKLGNITSIVVQESSSSDDDDSPRFEKTKSHGGIMKTTNTYQSNEIENNRPNTALEIYSENLSASKFLHIQKWLDGSPPVCLEDEVAVEHDSRLCTSTTSPTTRKTLSHVHETKEDTDDEDPVLIESNKKGKQIHCSNENTSHRHTNNYIVDDDENVVKANAHVKQNHVLAEDENALSLSAENVLDQLYGESWKKRHTTSQKTQIETRKFSNVLSSKDIDDSFDEFVKKFNTEHKKMCQNSKTENNTKAFINDESLSSDSLEFYQAVLNSDIKKQTRTGTESSKLQLEIRQKTTIRKLSYSSSSLSSSDVSDDDNDYLPKKDLTVKKDNLLHSKERGLGILKPKEPNNVHTKGNSKINRKGVSTYHSQTLHLNIQTKVLSVKVCSFLESLSVSVSESHCHPEALQFRKNFKKRKEELSTKLFEMYNLNIFNCALPKDLQIKWNTRLQRTAGLCFNRRILAEGGEKVRTSRVELSIKVCDAPDRLRDTLVHELCHAATWVKDGVQGGHGPNWKAWARRAMKCYPELPPVKRCHEYKIQTKFTYKCSGCGYSINRHSKSLDTEKKRCGYCYGKFELFVNYKNKSSTNTVQTPRNPNGFALFVKENYNVLRSAQKDLKHGDVMRLLGQQFSAAKIS